VTFDDEFTQQPSAEEFFGLYPELLRYAFYLIGSSGSREDAEDITQEALVNAWTFRHQLAVGCDCKPWLKQILRHKVAEHFRIQNSVRKVKLSAMDQTIFEEVFSKAPEDEPFIDPLVLKECIKQLVPSDQELITDRYTLNKRIKDMAESRNVTPNAVSKALNLARDRLRKLIERYQKQERTPNNRLASDGDTV